MRARTTKQQLSVNTPLPTRPHSVTGMVVLNQHTRSTTISLRFDHQSLELRSAHVPLRGFRNNTPQTPNWEYSPFQSLLPSHKKTLFQACRKKGDKPLSHPQPNSRRSHQTTAAVSTSDHPFVSERINSPSDLRRRCRWYRRYRTRPAPGHSLVHKAKKDKGAAAVATLYLYQRPDIVPISTGKYAQ
jgi:hypothetical protein